MRAIVVGCGVSGLSTGIRLLEAGYEVEMWARELPPDTTSNIEAAKWYPYKAFPKERVLAWGERALELFYEMVDDAASGVCWTTKKTAKGASRISCPGRTIASWGHGAGTQLVVRAGREDSAEDSRKVCMSRAAYAGRAGPGAPPGVEAGAKQCGSGGDATAWRRNGGA